MPPPPPACPVRYPNETLALRSLPFVTHRGEVREEGEGDDPDVRGAERIATVEREVLALDDWMNDHDIKQRTNQKAVGYNQFFEQNAPLGTTLIELWCMNPMYPYGPGGNSPLTPGNPQLSTMDVD